jgi:hypothetical protein
MTSHVPLPLVFFRVLADRAGKPAALLLDIGAGEAADPAALLTAGDTLDALVAHFPCLYRAAPDSALALALDEAGLRPLPAGAVLQADDGLPTDVAATVSWIDGAWCLAPPPKAQGAQAASRVLALQLVQLVAADADTHAIEALLRREPTLSYQLLRLVNSLGVGAGRRVNSFAQAILILGRQQLRRWLNLMLFAARQGDARSPMLLARVAVRARALELLAKSLGLDKSAQEQAFMTGMFSLLGVLFGMELAEVLAPLAIGEAVHAALLRGEGDLGALLALVCSAEAGDLAAAARQLAALHIDPADFNAAMLDAAGWMLGAVRENQGDAHA